MSTREESLKILYDLLETNTLEDLQRSHNLYVHRHPTENLAILHYGKSYMNVQPSDPGASGKFSNNKKMAGTDSCRGLIIETDYPYKIISHGYDRFIPRHEDDNTIINLKKATVKEDGSLMFVFKHGKSCVNTQPRDPRASGDNFCLSTMYDFATGPVAFSDKTYTELFLEIIGLPLNDFANSIISQIDQGDQIMTMCFEMCSLENRVIKSYNTPTLFLTSVYGGPNGTTEFVLPDVLALPSNVKLIQQVEFPNQSITIAEAHAKVLELSKDDLMFEGIVLQTTDNRRIKIKNPLYNIHHNLKYKGWVKCTPEIMIPLIFDGLDDIVIANVVSASPHDQLFTESELKKRKDYYCGVIIKERLAITEAVNHVKELDIVDIKNYISLLKEYDANLFAKWSGFLFHLYRNNFDFSKYPEYFVKNIGNIFVDRDPFLSQTHSQNCCKFVSGSDKTSNQPNGGIGTSSTTCYCGNPMKLTELRTELVRYRYCHCGEAYDYQKYGCWTNLMMCTSPTCTCTHEVNPYTKLPLGIPASNFCKSLRLEIHELINNSGKSKDECYDKIREITGKTREETHMAKFDIADCIKVLEEW